MGSYVACNLAFLQFLFQLYIFKKPFVDDSGPMLSCIFVMIAVLIFLLNIPLYPRYLRKLGKIGHFMVQYLLAVFLMEHIMADFWFPLDIFIMGSFCNLGELLEDFLDTYKLNCGVICKMLKSQHVPTYFDILIAVIILTLTMQATRVIDFGILAKNGLKPFFWKIIERSSCYKLFKSFKKSESRRSKSPSRKLSCPLPNRSQLFCDEEEDSD